MAFLRPRYGLCFLLLCLCFHLGAKVEKGLMFRSYEVVPELRTSLVIPRGGEQISFKDSLIL